MNQVDKLGILPIENCTQIDFINTPFIRGGRVMDLEIDGAPRVRGDVSAIARIDSKLYYLNENACHYTI